MTGVRNRQSPAYTFILWSIIANISSHTGWPKLLWFTAILCSTLIHIQYFVCIELFWCNLHEPCLQIPMRQPFVNVLELSTLQIWAQMLMMRMVQLLPWAIEWKMRHKGTAILSFSPRAQEKSVLQVSVLCFLPILRTFDPPPVPSHLQSALRFQNDTQSTSFGASMRPEFVTPNRPTVRLPSTVIGKTFTAAIK